MNKPYWYKLLDYWVNTEDNSGLSIPFLVGVQKEYINDGRADEPVSALFSEIVHGAAFEFKYPVDFWTPDKDVAQMFALDEEVYKMVYDKPACDIVIDKAKERSRIKAMINLLIQQKDALRFADLISINDTVADPTEDEALKTTLDEKLNSLLKPDDENRILFHRVRANYKVYIESFTDIDSELRSNILKWESNLRLKASRLTMNFQMDDKYTPAEFFRDFFKEAKNEILTFFKDYELKGDKEKLLQGVVFELAAQCPLDWRKNGSA